MKDHTECKRKFINLSRAWYGDANLRGSEVLDEITIGFYHPDGGTTGEFTIRWIELGGEITPMLCSYDDSWDALWQFRDVLKKMVAKDGENPSPTEMCELLESCGIEDATPTKSPYGDDPAKPRQLYAKPKSSGYASR